MTKPNEAVESILRDRIDEEGQITFAEFMDISLFSPEGYYSSQVEIGEDFKTAPEIHPAFGYTVANKITALRTTDEPLRILEVGAGNGTLARDILHRFARSRVDVAAYYDYHIVEQSPLLTDKQRALLHDLPVTWHDDLTPEAAIAPDSIDIVISNELLDTFPVHRVRSMRSGLKEVFVTTDHNGKFIEVIDELSQPAQKELSEQHLSVLTEAPEITISPPQRKWIRQIGDILCSGGQVLTIDYAVDQAKPESYEPRVYAKFLEPPTGHPVQLAYEYPGKVDITASVDFQYLAACGRLTGLEVLYSDTQANFLRNYGFEVERNRLIELETQKRGSANTMAHYFGSFILLSADHMGDHRVLVQQKL